MGFFRRLFGIKHEHIWQYNEIYEDSAYNGRGKDYKYHRICIECGKEQFQSRFMKKIAINYDEWEDKMMTKDEKRNLDIDTLLK